MILKSIGKKQRQYYSICRIQENRGVSKFTGSTAY